MRVNGVLSVIALGQQVQTAMADHPSLGAGKDFKEQMVFALRLEW